MNRPEDLAALAARTAEIYQRNAARFDAERARVLFERGWLERFAALLPAGGSVLDVGCGAGEPLAAFIIERGHAVTGVDIAPAMIERARARFPAAVWTVGDMRTLDMGRTFDGILGWHSFFHLRPDEQRATLPRFAAHLNPGGVLMITVGPAETEVVGRVGDDPIYHASLAPDEYRRILAALGLRIVRFVPEDPSCDQASVLLARKRDGP